MRLRKVLIANRGEIAVRVARTCRAMGIRTVAVFSDADAGARHVQVCDEAVRLPGAAPVQTYLDGERLVAAARRTGADAVHPGYGFLAENAGFARQVVEAGLIWVGPDAEVIAAMGDKLEARRRMADAGVPVIPAVELDPGAGDDLVAQGRELGFPLMVKAAAGGGGKGMRVVDDPGRLVDAVAAARREAVAAFGDERVFLERLIERPRHIEVQVLGDRHGRLVHLYERECSIQRRHQKVIEETPSPGIDAELRIALCETAIAAAATISYTSAGTVEFIVNEAVLARRRSGTDEDPREAFAFLEVNTRLQVEHPITEEVVRVRETSTGRLAPLDLVRHQLMVAADQPLPFTQDDLVPIGHAIEARLYAEDPAAGHLPATGTLHAFVPDAGPGVRWDTGVCEGDPVTAHYDPLLAKVVAHAPTRDEAAARLAGTLDRTLLHGVTTNRDLLVAVLRDEAFLAGNTTTGYLDERFADGSPDQVAAEAVDTALVAATLHGAVRRTDAARVVATLPPGWSNTGCFDPETSFLVDGLSRRVRYRVGRDGSFAVDLDVPIDTEPADGDTLEVVVHGFGERWIDLEVAGHRQRCAVLGADGDLQVTTPAGRVALAELPRFPEPAADDRPGATLAPMPGAVVSVAVGEGERVLEGQLLVTVEAMKMEHRVLAPIAGRVAEVRVRPGQQVNSDEVLVVVEPDADEPRSEA